MKVTCERCMYWDNSHEEERAQVRSGFCRQPPPHPEWHWALTDPHDWCGQAMPRDSGSTQPVDEAAQRVLGAWDNGWKSPYMVQRLEAQLGREAA